MAQKKPKRTIKSGKSIRPKESLTQLKGPRKINLAVLVSGRGSNLQALLEACKKPAFPARVAVVISDNPRAYALERAKKSKVPTAVFDRRHFPDRKLMEAEIDKVLARYGIGLICLAGFMRLLSSDFVARHHGRIINIHPALLPAFPGLHVQQKAVDHGVRWSGCTVHFVDAGADTGPIILQAIVPVKPDDTGDTLAARILEQEHRIYPRAVKLFAAGRLRIEGRKVIIK